MNLLLPYDGASHSQPALEEAARIAGAERAAVTVISIVRPGDSPSRFATGPQPHAQADVTAAHAYLRERGIESDVKVEVGDPAEEILREAEAGSYDLIVMGTHGRGTVARLLLGSVSTEVAEKATCPVIVVGADHRLRVEPKVSEAV